MGKKNSVNANNPRLMAMITAAKRFDNIKLCVFLCSLKKYGYLLQSKDAIKIFAHRDSGLARGHIVASHIVDWWNIKSENSGGDWPNYISCYYGNFSNPSS